MRFTVLENLTASQSTSNAPLPIDQLMVAALLGGGANTVNKYDDTKTYAKNEKIVYYTPEGRPVILCAKGDNTTGAFDLTKWTTFNLMSGSGVSGGGSAMSDAKLTGSLGNSVVDSIMNI